MQDFEQLMMSRSAGEYAEFLLPHLRPGTAVLDCGCGPASITCGIAERLPEGLVIGLDLEDGFHAARGHAETRSLFNLTFVRGDINSLPFRSGTLDAVLAHSLFEILGSPSAALAEVQRVLRSDGVVGIAAVDYSGLLLSGPFAETLQQFYRLKEQYWERCLHAEPRRGRHLRSLLSDAGFRDVRGSARYVSYGSREAVTRLAEDRARECEEQSFMDGLSGLALTDQSELREMAIAWRRWGTSAASFLAFPWCSAVGWK